MNPLSAPPLTSQRGAVLLVSLMILLIMTVLGIAGMGTTTMEEKMAANNQQQQQAYQAAETALRDAETWLTTNVTRINDLTQFNGSNGLYALRAPVTGGVIAKPAFDIYDNSAWTSNGLASQHTLLDNQDAPRYIIEYMGDLDDPLDPNDPMNINRYSFRVTAVGWSVDGTARYMAMSHYVRRLN